MKRGRPHRLYEYQGEHLPLSEIAARCGIEQSVLYKRVRLGW